MANTLVFPSADGSIGYTGNTITVTPHATNKLFAVIFFNSNSQATTVAAAHSVDGAMTAIHTQIDGSGQLAAFELDNAGDGTVTFSWGGGSLDNLAFVVSVEGEYTTIFDPVNGISQGSAGAVSVLSEGSANEHIAFCGQRYAAAVAATSDTEIGSAISAGVVSGSIIQETWASDDAADWVLTGGSVYTATSYLLVSDVADTVNPLITNAAAAADGGSVTINFSEAVDVGAGGSGGFTVPATYGTVTLTPTTTLPASTIVFSTSRVLQNGETISGAFAQPGNGFEDAAGNDLVSGTFAVTNGSKVHRIFSNATKDTPYTTAGVSVRLLGSIGLTDATATQTLNPDVDGYIQVAEALSTGVYAKVLSSADGTVLGIGNHTVL